MLIGPFRMYFVKKRVKWDLVNARSLQPAAGSLIRLNRDNIQKNNNNSNSLRFDAKYYAPAILMNIMWNHVVVVEHAAAGSCRKQLSQPSWEMLGLRG